MLWISQLMKMLPEACRNLFCMSRYGSVFTNSVFVASLWNINYHKNKNWLYIDTQRNFIQTVSGLFSNMLTKTLFNILHKCKELQRHKMLNTHSQPFRSLYIWNRQILHFWGAIRQTGERTLMQIVINSVFLKYIFLQGKGDGERPTLMKEWIIDWDQAHNPDMGPNQGSNWLPFGARDDA